jgi:NAD-dependent deacetylase
MENLEKFREAVAKTNNMVFFGGAGVSTESGIPDFRSVDGLYNQSYKYPPETMLSHTFYEKHPDEFFRFYRDKVLHTEAQPNAAHLKLAEWEKEGKLKAVVTQNIDGLHQLAGSKNVLELHGSVLRNFCERCFKSYDVQFIIDCEGVPMCTCGARVKPDVVLYEEGLDQDILTQSVKAIAAADMLIIGGTSLVVYPAAGLIDYFSGSCLVVVNKAPTPRDKQADIVLQDSIGAVFSQV